MSPLAFTTFEWITFVPFENWTLNLSYLGFRMLDVDIATRIRIKEDGPNRSLLSIETADRPGLLVEIIKVIIDVESAEIDTEGLVAKDKFHVSYRGAALNSSLSQVLVNCLRYYLRWPETDIDSY
ncbi:ACT domain-containing protein DS12 [Hibiscus syriacus]|uniref:ACT domain-containing protein DS12 n=1 Tax=Hibiscus syriacus TaxID=106335 RepID=A0A6A2YGZ3_HIBSY|nr:ACT domain-containing protein DS12 [Hibiscus syriacus]